MQCQSCKAVLVFDPARVGQNCEFCGSPALVDYKEIKAPIRPQSLLPFKVPDTTVREQIRRWYASKWFAPGKLKSRALVDTVHGVYLPVLDVRRAGRAARGTPRRATTTTRPRPTATTRAAPQTRQVQHVRWEPASGRSITSSTTSRCRDRRGRISTLLRAIEPFPTKELVPYDAAFLSGFVVEHYQVVLLDAAQKSLDQMTAQLRELCAQQIPGDTYRTLEIAPQFSDRTFKHILVPVWLLTYTYGARVFQVLVNGYTGKMEGTYPKSPWKVIFAVVLVLLFVLLLLYSQSN